MNAIIEAAQMAEAWAIRRFPRLARGELLGLAWEAASRARPEHARRRAIFAVQDAIRSDRPRLSSPSLAGPRQPRKEWAGSAASLERLRNGPPVELKEPDWLSPLWRVVEASGLTPAQADALAGWAVGRSPAAESIRLGVSKDRVSQLRYRALERLGVK